MPVVHPIEFKILIHVSRFAAYRKCPVYLRKWSRIEVRLGACFLSLESRNLPAEEFMVRFCPCVREPLVETGHRYAWCGEMEGGKELTRGWEAVDQARYNRKESARRLAPTQPYRIRPRHRTPEVLPSRYSVKSRAAAPLRICSNPSASGHRGYAPGSSLRARIHL